MINQLKTLLYFFGDLRPKICSRFLHARRSRHIEYSAALSDSEKTPYIEHVEKVLQNNDFFSRFRKDYEYRHILEHVSYKQGLAYIEKINVYGEDPTIFSEFIRRTRGQGKPREYNYKKIGLVSPTILRYLATLVEIRHLFALDYNPVVAEVGIGFAGQISTFLEYLNPGEICTYDLPQVQELASRYLQLVLSSTDVTKVKHEDIYDIQFKETDLVISNYAFSELPEKIQREYIEKLFINSSAGYLMMNSGRTNYTGRSSGKLSLSEILELLPGSSVFEESPKTGPDNYLIIWGNVGKPLS